MGEARLDPPLSMPTYAVRAPLVRWLRAEAERAHGERGSYRVLDVGCGEKPYEVLFPHASAYVGVDPEENPRAELRGSVEALPVEDGSFDLVLCSQVLEHCDDPTRAVAELRRVTAPGGRVLASTHGVMTYHPSPTDYWRWTHAGLEKLFAENGAWSSVTVTPSSGTTACLGMIVSMYLDLTFRKLLHAGLLAKPMVASINAFAATVDSFSPRLRRPVPGTMFANFHVVADVPR